jgi:trimeric autotransporter adhesin
MKFFSRRDRTFLASKLSAMGMRWLLVSSIATLGSLNLLTAAIAAPLAGGITIKNTAVGSFVDEDAPASTVPTVVESNEVVVTVSEVTGIAITSVNTPTPVNGSIANFDFAIKNIGNDPTKFFLPIAPSSISGGMAGTLQVVGYIPASGTPVNLTTPINITTATNTGSLSDPTLGGNTTFGSIPVDAAIIVRIPVTVTAATGSSVAMTLGDTTGSPTNSNTPYVVGSHDVYTFDNADGQVTDEAIGDPVNGDVGHRQEASVNRTVPVIAAPASISGVVFEDPNYGGGAGRPLNTPTTSSRSGARVELYHAVTGAFQAFTLTDNNGAYKFDTTNVTGGIVAGDYKVRVVNNTVTSSRVGYVNTLIPVQTFRTDAMTGVVNNVIDRVGGEKPTEIDALANTTSATLASLDTPTAEVQSITMVKVINSSVTGINFGYNFDTIVNTKNSGQGSLSQFITNSNALGGESSLPGGYETSIFMIPNRTANPGHNSNYVDQLTGGVAIIQLSSDLPFITGNRTKLDGSTQSANVKNGVTETNPGQISANTTVGILGTALASFKHPEVEIRGATPSLSEFYTLTASGSFNEIKNIAFNAHRILVTGSNSVVADNFMGMRADGSGDAASANVPGHGIEARTGSDITIRHNYVRVNDSGIRSNSSGSRFLVDSNWVDLPSSGQTNTFDGVLLIGTSTDSVVQNNLVQNMKGAGLELGFGNGSLTNALIDNNTFKHNGYDGTVASLEPMGVVAYSAPNSMITLSRNIITDSSGSGVIVLGGAGNATGIKLTKNSIFKNGIGGNGLSINIDPNASTNSPGPNNYGVPDGVTPNTGVVSASLPNGGMNYPIFTKVQRTGSILKLEGYIGSSSAGNPAFTGATIEVYKADDDGNQNGKVFSSDPATVSKPHGEGRYWMGSFTAGTNGLFSYNLPILTSLTDGLNLTTLMNADKITAIATSPSTATIAPNSTSEFSENVPFTFAQPNLLLVKRITRVNGSQRIGSQYDLSQYQNEAGNVYDDNVIDLPTTALKPDTDKWPNSSVSGGVTSSTFLIGGTNGGNVRPTDEVEYTIYFLSAGEDDARGVLFCDLVPDNQTFVPNAYGAAANGLDRGINLFTNNTSTSLTNLADSDIGRYYPPADADTPQACRKYDAMGAVTASGAAANTRGAIVVRLGTVVKPDPVTGSPVTGHGYIRFRARVN